MVTVEVVVAFCVIGSFALVFYDMSEFCSTCTGIFRLPFAQQKNDRRDFTGKHPHRRIVSLFDHVKAQPVLSGAGWKLRIA